MSLSRFPALRRPALPRLAGDALGLVAATERTDTGRVGSWQALVAGEVRADAEVELAVLVKLGVVVVLC